MQDFALHELKGAGFHLRQLFSAGFTLKQLLDAGSTVQELGEAGATVPQLHHANITLEQLQGFTVPQLSDALSCPAGHCKVQRVIPENNSRTKKKIKNIIQRNKKTKRK